MTSKDISRNVYDFILKAGKGETDFDPLPDKGPFEINNGIFDDLKKILTDDVFVEKKLYTKEVFNYLQEILNRGLKNKGYQEELRKLVANKCLNYIEKRPDLIENIQPVIFRKIDNINCFVGNLSDLNPINFRYAKKDQLDRLIEYVEKDNTAAEKVKTAFEKNNKFIISLDKNKSFTDDMKKRFYRTLGLSESYVSGAIDRNIASVQNKNSTTMDISSVRNENAARSRNTTARNNASVAKQNNASVAKRNNTTVVTRNNNLRVKNKKTATGTEELSISTVTKNNSPPKPESLLTESALLTATNAKPTEEDVQDILQRIKNHLDRWKYVDESNYNEDTFDGVLKLGNNVELSVPCVLHYLSGSSTFLESNRNDIKCSSNIKNYLVDKQIDLSALINLVSLDDGNNMKFLANSQFYHNLYLFNIAMVQYLIDSDEFKNTDLDVQKNLLEGVQQFMKQTIRYLQKYMEQYEVIDQKLLNSSYNLLFIMNTINLQRANMGKNINDLIGLYQRLIDAVNENITIYKQIDLSKIKLEQGSTGTGTSLDIENLYNELTSRYDLLVSQRDELERNVELINNQREELSTLASPDVIAIANRFNQN